MNEKANVSKELDAKHRRVLESLLKLPENRECADCKSKGPRWASVNLGIFICMQCAGIHRSLGVHISKVRSATLDTWLSEQIAFIQSMGNEKSNSYWEAELRPNYDRVGIENFIRAKYEEKRWVPREGKAKSPSRASREHASIYGPGPKISGQRQMNNTSHASEERKVTHPPITNDRNHTSSSCTSVPVKVSLQVIPDTKPHKSVQNPEPAASKGELAKKEDGETPVLASTKVDYATELFNLLCLDDSKGSDSKTPANGNAWGSFQSAAAQAMTGRSDPPLTAPSLEKPTKDAKNDIGNCFEKSSMVSPFSIHQQQHAMLPQQQPFLMSSVASSIGGFQTLPANVHRLGYNGIYLPGQNWRNAGHQAPGMMMPVGDPQKFVQVGNSQQMYSSGNSIYLPTSSMYRPGPMAPINGVTNFTPIMPRPAFPVTPTQPEGHSEFSSFTQGMFMR